MGAAGPCATPLLGPGNWQQMSARRLAAPGILEIRTVEVGIVVIKGVESEYYLAMNKSGKVYAKKLRNEDCNFEEMILENHYNTYASAKWRHTGKRMFVAINNKGIPMKGKKSKKGQKASHFLPMRISNNS